MFFVKNSIIKFLLCYLRLYHRILHFYIDLSKNTTVNNEIKLNSNLLLAIRYINDNISYQFSIDELAKAANTSISTLERNFCHFLGMTPSKYIRQRRLGIAIGYLNSGKSVTEACFNVSCRFKTGCCKKATDKTKRFFAQKHGKPKGLP